MLQSQTKSQTTYRVYAGQLNEHNSLYGGQTLAWLDGAASLAARRFDRVEWVTASIDTMEFIAPVSLGDAIEYTSWVTGVGTRSIEVAVKLTGETMATGHRYLAGVSLMTFVAPKGSVLPKLELDDPEGRKFAPGYAKRKAENTQRRRSLAFLKANESK